MAEPDASAKLSPCRCAGVALEVYWLITTNIQFNDPVKGCRQVIQFQPRWEQLP
jgi:hypothetical protein